MGLTFSCRQTLPHTPYHPLWSRRWEEPTSKLIIQAEFKWHVCGGKCAVRATGRGVNWLLQRGSTWPRLFCSQQPLCSARCCGDVRAPNQILISSVRASEKLIENIAYTRSPFCCRCTSFRHCSLLLLP